VEQAQATLGQARANRTDIPVAREDINAARAAVRSAQAQLQTALVNLAYADIRSPLDGVVNQKLTDEGESAAPGTPLLNLVSLDRVYFEAQVSENNVRRVRVGQPARVSVPAVSDQPLNSYVSDIIPVADPRFRQFRIRITIPRAPRELTPGVFARGTLTTQAINNTLVVPTDAVQRMNGQPALLVAVPSGETAQIDRRLVKIGVGEAGRTQVLGGVQSGEQIVVGNQPLEDGDKVRIAKGQ
jgi:RND family efflux transporter MFP subunit